MGQERKRAGIVALKIWLEWLRCSHLRKALLEGAMPTKRIRQKCSIFADVDLENVGEPTI
jgi:hypothetical protein